MIYAILVSKAAGCNIAVLAIWWMDVFEIDAAVVMCCTLRSPNGRRVDVCAWHEQPLILPDRMDDDKDKVR